MTEPVPESEFPQFEGYNQCLVFLERGELTVKKMKKIIPKDNHVLRTLVSHQMAFVELFETYMQDEKLGRAMKVANNVTLDSHRRALLQRIDALLVERIEKHLENENMEKARKWIDRLSTDELRSKFLNVLRGRTSPKNVSAEDPLSTSHVPSAPDAVVSSGPADVTDVPSESVDPRILFARGCLREKLGEDSIKFSQDVLDELSRLIADHWLPKDLSKKKVSLHSVGRTELLVMGVLLGRMHTEEVLSIQDIAQEIDIVEKSVLRALDQLKKTALRSTPYTLAMKKPKDGCNLVRR